ncbi:MAG: UDP-3-O-[3-hydroxymyristoyl] N-acetylglucosamine deacetylase, partial [Alphaproteobacteria bacterium HGW-Alphaproteobacteria-8]
MQATLSRSISFSGVGLHGGKPARIAIRPAPAGAGVWFCRVDVTDRDQMIPARFDAVSDTRLCTVLSNAAGVSVSTVEHVMAALAGCGVDNALVDIDGPEMPIMDGSAQVFVDAIQTAGLAFDATPRRALRILTPVIVERGDARAELHPAAAFAMDFAIAFDDAAIGRQRHAMTLREGAFAAELADCRTFTRLTEIEQLRAHGLALGGSLDNAVVVDGARVLNPGGLRRPDEFVRHKMLDAVGDLALAGGPIIGRYVGVRAGHALTNTLLRALFAREDAWRWEPAAPR